MQYKSSQSHRQRLRISVVDIVIIRGRLICSRQTSALPSTRFEAWSAVTLTNDRKQSHAIRLTRSNFLHTSIELAGKSTWHSVRLRIVSIACMLPPSLAIHRNHHLANVVLPCCCCSHIQAQLIYLSSYVLQLISTQAQIIERSRFRASAADFA